MIGLRIRLARTEKKLSLRVVGEAMGVTPQAVAQWERSNPKFDIEKSHKLANILDVDIDWLLGRSGTDDKVMASGLSSAFNGRIPIIPKQHVALFVLFNRANFRPHEYNETLEPSAKVVGQAFAIRLESDSEFPPLSEGDIMIFDNGRIAKKGQVVAAIAVDEFVRTVFAICIESGETNANGEEILALAGPPQSESEDNLERLGGATPVGVLIELRSFKSPGFAV